MYWSMKQEALYRVYRAMILDTCAGSWVQKLGGKSERTKQLRSMTPPGFAKAFYLANK